MTMEDLDISPLGRSILVTLIQYKLAFIICDMSLSNMFVMGASTVACSRMQLLL